MVQLQHLGQPPPGRGVRGLGRLGDHLHRRDRVAAALRQQLGELAIGFEVPQVVVLDPAPGFDGGLAVAGPAQCVGQTPPVGDVLAVQIDEALEADDRVGRAALIDQQAGGGVERFAPQRAVQLRGAVEASHGGVDLA